VCVCVCVRICVCVYVFTLRLRLRLEAELQGVVGPLTEPVAGQREGRLHQHQAGLKVGPDGVLRHAGQPARRRGGREAVSTGHGRGSRGSGVTHVLVWSLMRSHTARLLPSLAKYMAPVLFLDTMLQSAPYSSRRRTTSAFPRLHACRTAGL